MNPFDDLEEWPSWVALWHQHDAKGLVIKEDYATIEERALREVARSDATWGPFGWNLAAVQDLHKTMWEKLRAQIASGERVVYGFQPPSATIAAIDPRMASRLEFDILTRTAEGEGLNFRGIEIRPCKEARIEGTGAPGRPTSMHLILAEARRRLSEGKLEDSQVEAATSLQAWLRAEYPEAPVPGAKTITNRLAALRRKPPATPSAKK